MSEKINAAAESPPVPPEGYEPNVTVSTFEDYGSRLPIGYLKDGELHRGFAFRRFTMKEERALEAIRKKQRRMTMGSLVSTVLAHMLTRLGPYDMDSLDDGPRRLLVNQMYMADVMYAYIMLRIEALGPEVAFDVDCATCAHRWRFKADMTRTDVKVAEDLNSLVRRYTMRDGVETPDGTTVKDLLLQPPRWHAMASLKADGGMGDVKMFIMASAIRQVGEGKFPATADLLDTMTKYDLEHLQRAIDDLTPGPELVLEATCPACAAENRRSLDWSWDFFFTASSL
jgi:hypothetical protein